MSKGLTYMLVSCLYHKALACVGLLYEKQEKRSTPLKRNTMVLCEGNLFLTHENNMFVLRDTVWLRKIKKRYIGAWIILANAGLINSFRN